jgi:hypothetical protein
MTKPKVKPIVAKIGGGWKRPFNNPIPLPRGRQLVTLKDAANYIVKLPKAEHGMADRDADIALGGRTERANDVYPYRNDASASPQRRAGIQSGSQRAALGETKIEEGRMTQSILNIVNTLGLADIWRRREGGWSLWIERSCF